MSWTANQVTQNGNTTRTWTTTGSSLSTHDAVVVGLTSGTTSRIRLHWVEMGRNPTSYRTRVQVIGSNAVAFRHYAEKMD
jgi:hypothetical protein